MSVAEHTPLPSLDATIAGFVQKLAAHGGPPLYTLSPTEARAVLAGPPTRAGGRFEASREEGDTGAQATVVFVEYLRAPEAQYPVAIEQAYAATQWVAVNGASIKVDPSRLALAGDSVGGNMVAAVTLLARERGGPPITFQVL